MADSPARRAMLGDLASAVAGRMHAGVTTVAIDGTDAAGKTVLARELARTLGACGVEVVHTSIDGFHNPARLRHARNPINPAESYYQDSFNYEAFLRCVIGPASARPAGRLTPQIFDSRTDSPVTAQPIELATPSVLLVDGIFLGRPILRDCWDVWVYVDVDPDVAMERGITRDAALLGGMAAARERYLLRYRPGQQIYLDEADPRVNADIVVVNNDVAAPTIVVRQQQ